MASGFADVLVGLQYGDEGKAKIVDSIAYDYDIIARFNGGSNAGHTVVVEGRTFTLRQVPSGVHHETCALYIGSGCVVDYEKLLSEIKGLESLGASVRERLRISPHSTVIQPHHILIDAIYSSEISTTKNGIGPAYADRCVRLQGGVKRHIRIKDLLEDDSLFLDVEKNLQKAICELNVPEGEWLNKVDLLRESVASLKELVAFDIGFLYEKVKRGKKVLFEGAQSVMLDVVHGTVPYVTSSSTVASSAFVGGDLPAKYLRKTIGVAKAIMSRVGHGPFRSEFEKADVPTSAFNARDFEWENFEPLKLISSDNPSEITRALRMVCGEYGSVTGRPRRIGALNLSELRESVRLNGVDELYLTKCDLLEYFFKTKEKVIPIFENGFFSEWPAFEKSLVESGSLSSGLVSFLEMVEGYLGVPIVGVGCGPGREALITRSNLLKVA